MDDGTPLWLRPKARIATERADVKLEQAVAGLNPPPQQKPDEVQEALSPCMCHPAI